MTLIYLENSSVCYTKPLYNYAGVGRQSANREQVPAVDFGGVRAQNCLELENPSFVSLVSYKIPGESETETREEVYSSLLFAVIR